VTEQIRFAGEQGTLAIEIYGYERSVAEDQDDANWLRAELTVKAGPFSGAFKSAFTTYDLTSLCDGMKNVLAALSGSMSFQNTEHDIAFNIEFDKRGGATINGTVHPHRSPEASLKFRFDTDQSYLAHTLSQLEALLRRFPIRQAR
jgi:hypothetical protein